MLKEFLEGKVQDPSVLPEEVYKDWDSWINESSKENPFLWTRVESSLSKGIVAGETLGAMRWSLYAAAATAGIAIGIALGTSGNNSVTETLASELFIEDYDYSQFTDLTVAEDELLQ